MSSGLIKSTIKLVYLLILLFSIFCLLLTGSFLFMRRVGKGEVKLSSISSPLYYDFDMALAFNGDRLALLNIKNYRRAEFEEIMLRGLGWLRGRVEKNIENILESAQELQLDPFWVMAIIWTESSFNPHAESEVKAKGLMQIMPQTARYLYAKIEGEESREIVQKLVVSPIVNTRLGVLYLKELLDKFAGDLKLATIAYNMGPYRVKWMQQQGMAVGIKNNYLNKVRTYYQLLHREFDWQMMEDFAFISGQDPLF